MRILITGATSLLGRSVADRLLDRGESLRTLQRSPSGLDCDEVLGDVRDASDVEAAVAGCAAVVHLAAKVGVVGSWPEFESVNVQGTLRLLAAARNAGVSHFVHVSSPSVAHGGESLVGAPAGPALPDAVRGHYARSKALAESFALDADRDGFAVAVLRPHLVWGPGDTQLVGRLVERARSGRLATVGTGAALIDTTYVDNAADAIVCALGRVDSIRREPLVVSNGQPRPIGEMVARIVTAAGLEPPRLSVPSWLAVGGGAVIEGLWERSGRSGDPPMTRFLAEQLSTAHWFDQRRTREALQWSPSVTIEEGLRRLEQWFASNVSGP